LKCVDLIEIRFSAYLYAPYVHVRWHIIFETTVQILEVEFGCKYGYSPWGKITNTDYWLLFDMQKRTNCNKICDKSYYATISVFISFKGG